MEWDISELIAFGEKLGRVPIGVVKDVDRATRKSGLDLVSLAQRKAPVKTGNLKNSIGMDVLGIAHVLVGPEESYGGWVERGTSRMDAQPYLMPARDVIEPVYVEALSQIAFWYLEDL